MTHDMMEQWIRTSKYKYQQYICRGRNPGCKKRQIRTLYCSCDTWTWLCNMRHVYHVLEATSIAAATAKVKSRTEMEAEEAMAKNNNID